VEQTGKEREKIIPSNWDIFTKLWVEIIKIKLFILPKIGIIEVQYALNPS